MILFPELALSEDLFDDILEFITKKRRINILVAGVQKEADGKFYNVAKTAYMDHSSNTEDDKNHKSKVLVVEQRKHHQWKLEKSQIKTYSIGNALDLNTNWWENIDVSNRELNFTVFRHGASFTTLICEDLARIDPCQSAIRCIGPNLVFALLMDGPQINGRWPERYALGLSDDPGSSVLSVTSLALINRSNSYHNTTRRCVALWRDIENGTKELELPIGAEGLLITLSPESREEFTLDGRSDNGSAYLWLLTGVAPISLES